MRLWLVPAAFLAAVAGAAVVAPGARALAAPATPFTAPAVSLASPALSLAAPVTLAAPAAVSLAMPSALPAPAACMPAVASASGALAPFFATAAAAAPDASADDAEPTMERFIDREFIASVVGAPAGRALTGAELETRTHDVGLLLRCPVCQGSSVADSPSSTAINMKNEVRDLLAQGYDQPQILAWFEASYGQFVLMQPKAEGLNMLVWLGPGVLLLAGLALVVLQIRKSMRGPEDDPSLAGDEPQVDPELESYLRDARALAFGDAAPPAAGVSRGNGAGPSAADDREAARAPHGGADADFHGRSASEASPDRRSN